MSIAVVLPTLGESVVEGTIAQWLVKEGDHVQRDQPLVEVTTDKVDAEIPSPVDGVIERITVSEGEVVAIGAELAWVDNQVTHARQASAEAAASVPPPLAEPSADEVRATPLARRVADAEQVDLRSVAASGAGNRITKVDVLDHARSAADPQPETPPAAAPAPESERVPASHPPAGLESGDRVIPMSPLRRLVAEHMVYSKHTSPHVGTVAEIDMGRVTALRDRHKGAFREKQGFGLSYLPFLVHATVRALREFPALNASVLEDAIVEKAHLHLGIAAETEKGLVVPVIRDADRLSLIGTAQAIDDLSTRARSKRLSADELRGGTFTISNPGRQGNLYGFAIINQPQVGILRMGEIVKRPVVLEQDGQDVIAIRPVMHLALSYDHRAVDGAPANGFLHRVRELLERAEFDL
jgi:2-oxoglutarate dehydrogenase E2 component (dihydrolipoamide succinyltransferase)